MSRLAEVAMDLFVELFGSMLAFVDHCFDRIVIHGYLSSLSRPDQVVYFFRQVVGVPVVSKEVLSRRTADYQSWVEAFARNHKTPIEWAEKGVRKEDHVRSHLRRMTQQESYGVYFIFKSLEQGSTFRISVPKYATRIIAFLRPSAAASHTTTSTYAMRFSVRWSCGWRRSSRSGPAITSMATASSSRS
jgi:hypothetical protein